MNILTQFREISEKNIKENLGDYLYNMVSYFTNPYNIDAYKKFAENFDEFTDWFTKKAYEVFIHALDEEFMQSNTRKQRYESKGYVTKPFLTKFGWITLKRRRYIDSEGGFMFVDRLLGLVKYKRMDIFVIGDLIEESATNSYAKAERNVSKTIGNKIKYDHDPNKNILSRATVRNNVLSATKMMKTPANDEVKAVELLNLMLDEKYVGSQFNDGKDYMIKSGVVFEGT